MKKIAKRVFWSRTHTSNIEELDELRIANRRETDYSGEVLLRVTIPVPLGALAEFEEVDDRGYREWLIPKSWLESRPGVKVVEVKTPSIEFVDFSIRHRYQATVHTRPLN